MSGENETAECPYQVAMMAPSRVGKTSFVAALLSDTRQLLAASPVILETVGSTRKRVAQVVDQLNGHLNAGDFCPEGIAGTQELFEYTLQLGVASAHVKLGILDFPGMLVDPDVRGKDEVSKSKWTNCVTWLQNSDVVVVPIDATVLMEAMSGREKAAANRIMQVEEVSTILGNEWAKNRFQRPPGAVILVPVKCESYLAVSGATRDRSQQLYERVHRVYEGLRKRVREGQPTAKIFYCPVDTIGAVELQRAQWNDGPEGLTIQTYFRVRPGKHGIETGGAENIFLYLCRQIASQQTQDQQTVASEAQQRAEESYGALGNFWYWITRRRAALRKQGSLELEKLGAFQDVMKTLQQRHFSHRWKEMD